MVCLVLIITINELLYTCYFKYIIKKKQVHTKIKNLIKY